MKESRKKRTRLSSSQPPPPPREEEMLPEKNKDDDDDSSTSSSASSSSPSSSSSSSSSTSLSSTTSESSASTSPFREEDSKMLSGPSTTELPPSPEVEEEHSLPAAAAAAAAATAAQAASLDRPGPPPPVRLSKAWKQRQGGARGAVPAMDASSTMAALSGGPLYTGGKLLVDQSHGWLWLPVQGRVQAIDARTGQVRVVVQASRSSSSYVVNEDDLDEEDELYQETDITAFAVVHHPHSTATNRSVIACLRNGQIRQYFPSSSSSDSDKTTLHHQNESLENNIPSPKQQQSPLFQVWNRYKPWGGSNSRSPHTLPITCVEVHSSSQRYCATGSVDGCVCVWSLTTEPDQQQTSSAYLTHVFRDRDGGGTDRSGSTRPAITALKWLEGESLSLQHNDQRRPALVLAVGRVDGAITIYTLLDDSTSKIANRSRGGGTASSSTLQTHLSQEHLSAVTAMEWISFPSTTPPSTDFSGAPADTAATTGLCFVSTGRDEVLNLWRVERNSNGKSNKSSSGSLYHRIQTIPMYEAVEGLVVLPGRGSSSDVLATAGSRGQVRLWQLVMTGSSEAATTGARATAANETTFLLPQLKLLLDPSSPTATSVSDAGSRRQLESSNDGDGEVFGGSFSQLAYYGRGGDVDQLVVADSEHNISFLALREHPTAATLSSSPTLSLETQHTLIGQYDDILDLKLLSASSSSSPWMVVATNSANVHLVQLSSVACSRAVLKHDPPPLQHQQPSAKSTPFGGRSVDDTLSAVATTVLCVDVSPCGRFIATCGKDKQMRLWHVSLPTEPEHDFGGDSSDKVEARCIAVAVGHVEAIGSTALSKKANRYSVTGKAAQNGAGAFVVTASMDRTLKRWNLPGADNLEKCAAQRQVLSLQAFSSVRAHEKDINITAVAPNDSLIATGSQDKTVRLWKSTDLSLQATLKGHRRGVWDCQFSPYDRVLATGSGDKMIKLWSLSDYSCVRTFQGHVASVLRVRFVNSGMQLVSSGADGLVKLWTIRTNECEATMDGHSDKVWALDMSQDGKLMVSGGADSRIVVWDDCTLDMENAKKAEEEEAVLMDQRLANFLRHKEYAEALEISLERDKPHQALKVIIAIIENDLQKGHRPVHTLQRLVKAWPMERIAGVLRFCREWNTRARNSQVAMLLIQAIVTSFPVQELVAFDGVPEILAGIIPYAERHFDRLDRLYASSYLLDFTLSSMGSLDADEPDADFKAWEAKSKLVLPPKILADNVQTEDNAVIGGGGSLQGRNVQQTSSDVPTVGDSDSSDDD